jgi:hypothetical protein
MDGLAHPLLPSCAMRIFLGFLVAVVLIGGFLTHKKTQDSVSADQKPSSLIVPSSTPRPASPHNWPKSSLDRVAEVKKQVADSRRQNQPE